MAALSLLVVGEEKITVTKAITLNSDANTQRTRVYDIISLKMNRYAGETRL